MYLPFHFRQIYIFSIRYDKVSRKNTSRSFLNKLNTIKNKNLYLKTFMRRKLK